MLLLVWGESSEMSQPCFVGGILLILFMATQSASGLFHVIGPSTAFISTVGEEIVFSCHLSPQMDAQNMEVKWYNLYSLGLVHHYKSFQDQKEHQSPEYQGRTEFLKENITKGQVALRIRNIHPSDEGEYSCFFASSSHYSEAQFQLLVTGTGTEPHIHMEHGKIGEIKLTCTSTGWYPEPEVLWRDMQGQHLASVSEKKTAENNGIFHVETSVIVDEFSKRKVSCFIRNPLLSVVKEAYVSLPGDLYYRITLWTAIVLAAVFLVNVIVCIWIKYKHRFNCVRKVKGAEQRRNPHGQKRGHHRPSSPTSPTDQVSKKYDEALIELDLRNTEENRVSTE